MKMKINTKVKIKANIIQLDYDILQVLFKFFSLTDTYNLMASCKLFSVLEDDVWGVLCTNYYPIEFWNRAMARPKSASKPLGSNKLELKRLRDFEHNVGHLELDYYYKLWDMYDNVD